MMKNWLIKSPQERFLFPCLHSSRMHACMLYQQQQQLVVQLHRNTCTNIHTHQTLLDITRVTLNCFCHRWLYASITFSNFFVYYCNIYTQRQQQQRNMERQKKNSRDTATYIQVARTHICSKTFINVDCIDKRVNYVFESSL